MNQLHAHQLQDPILNHAQPIGYTLSQDMMVDDALRFVRTHGVGERIIYFYVTDQEGKLVGVVPTRRLLTAQLTQSLSDIMIRNVIAIPESASVLEACEFFVMHRFLAFPIVDDHKRLKGVVDISLFAEEVFTLAEREKSDAMFEALGFRIAQLRDASPHKAFRYRFPWLLATIASGTICALLTGFFAKTLADSLILAFFMTLVLGLAESVSVQSMTVTIQSLRVESPTLRWFQKSLLREFLTAVMLGLGCCLLVAVLIVVTHGMAMSAAAIGLSIGLTVIVACLIGISIPSLMHALRLDPKIASGPITLALTDIMTIMVYFSLAVLLL